MTSVCEASSMMVDAIDLQRLARCEVAAAYHPEGCWRGELSSSALSTAVAIVALHAADPSHHHGLIERGVTWLINHQLSDGSWGDTPQSPGNLSTTLLAWAALGVLESTRKNEDAEAWLLNRVETLDPATMADAIIRSYGDDRTFSVPILSCCAITGRLGHGQAAWRQVPQLPFEWAALPHFFWRLLRLPVVSYALPALIAIGQSRHYHRPTRFPLTRWLRMATRRRTLRLLAAMQPSNGGFLEAAPLTAFVAMNLCSASQTDHPVVSQSIAFLSTTVKGDGSWPIDTSLSTWLTSLAIAAAPDELSDNQRDECQGFYEHAQFSSIHPFTNAQPGGWSWTPDPGGVPDADDTAGALVALHHLSHASAPATPAVCSGITWLLNLQNADGGVATFCKGWNKLPFDRSAPDITAHALLAIRMWHSRLPEPLATNCSSALRRMSGHLISTQAADGSWQPLWFGNQYTSDLSNRVYGTARVLICLHESTVEAMEACIHQAEEFLLSEQHANGAWGGVKPTHGTLEETALTIHALAHPNNVDATEPAITRGVSWCKDKIRQDGFTPSPIGLYFSKLWYSEKLYPSLFLSASMRAVVEARRNP